MALNFQVDEATAAQRRFPLYLVDATDGITAETGEAAGQPQLSKNGAAFANTSATLTAIGNGSYYVELTAGELDTLGMVTIRFKSAATAEFSLTGQVVSFDPYDATPPVDVTQWNGSAVVAPNTAGVPVVDLIRIVGGLVPTPTTTGVPDVNVERWLDTLVTLGAGAPDVNVQSLDAGSIVAGVMAANSIASGVIAAAELTNIEDEIWDALKSAHVVANSFGDFLDIEVSGRATQADILSDATPFPGASITEVRLAELAAANLPTDIANVQADTDDIQTRLPAALVGGAMDSDISNMQADVMTASALNVDAVQEITRAINPQVNNALNDITFEMYDSTTHNPSTGLTVTGERSLNGGAYAAVTGTITEISDGTYQLDASAADMNGALIVFRFSEATADDTFVHVKTAA